METRSCSSSGRGCRSHWQGLNQQQPQCSQDKLNNSHYPGLLVVDCMVGQELLSPTVCLRAEIVEGNQLSLSSTLSTLACLVARLVGTINQVLEAVTANLLSPNNLHQVNQPTLDLPQLRLNHHIQDSPQLQLPTMELHHNLPMHSLLPLLTLFQPSNPHQQIRPLLLLQAILCFAVTELWTPLSPQDNQVLSLGTCSRRNHPSLCNHKLQQLTLNQHPPSPPCSHQTALLHTTNQGLVCPHPRLMFLTSQGQASPLQCPVVLGGMIHHQ